jgi:hypothetical protein
MFLSSSHNLAPEGREDIAHGASRGKKERALPSSLSPGEGRQNLVVRLSYAPPGLGHMILLFTHG